MEIKKTETANITEENFETAAKELYDDYGLEFYKDAVLTYVLNTALDYPDDVGPWIECLTPEQTRDILNHMRDVFTDYINEITNEQWDAVMEER